MIKAYVKGYGEVPFDPVNHDNNFYELYCVCICEDEEVVREEHYTNEDDYISAINNTFGREYMSTYIEEGYCEVEVYYGPRLDGRYECECGYHFAYVVDNEE